MAETIPPSTDGGGSKVPFSPKAKKALKELSLREALRLGHNYIGTEHLVLGVLRVADGDRRPSATFPSTRCLWVRVPTRASRIFVQQRRFSGVDISRRACERSWCLDRIG